MSGERSCPYRGSTVIFPVDGVDMGVRLILWFSWMFVLETFDGTRDIFEHGEVDDAVLVVPINIKT